MNGEHTKLYQHTVSVVGMACASSGERIVERQLYIMAPVSYVSVNLATERARVNSNEPIDEQQVKSAAEKNAGIISVSGSLLKLSEAVGLSKKTFGTTGQNLFWDLSII
ncbi:MAG: heavy metal translocating P-type ATPase [Spirochaetota bacterium]